MRPRSTTPPSAERATDLTELLTQALERAVVVARQDAASHDAPPPPVALRPVLRFTRLPTRALRTVYEVLDADAEFRSRVAATVQEADVGRASWVFLERPEGWQSELALLSDAADEELADERASREEQSATRRAAQLEETLERLREERDEAVRSAEVAAASAAVERRTVRALEAERDELLRERDELESARSRAVKELKRAESLAADRLAELRLARDGLASLEDQLDAQAGRTGTAPAPDGDAAPVQARLDGPGSEPGDAATAPAPGDPWRRVDPAAVAAAVAAASHAATSLSDALESAAELLRGTDDAATDPTPAATPRRAEADRPSRAAASRPPRRTPVRLRQGVHEGSAEGVEQLLNVEGLVAIVDGYNVSMELWPALGRAEQRESLIRGLGSLVARFPATIHVVFDGDDDGRRPTVGAPLPVRVHFSHAEVEADDRILAMVAELPTDVPVMVVSTDRRVADGARRLGANAVRSAELIALIAR